MAQFSYPGRNINNLRYADNTTLTAEREEELKSLLMKEESEKPGLKLNIQKTNKITVSGPITSWQIDRETMETVRDFILGDSKITADGDCSHEIKMLAPWKKSCDRPISVQLLSHVRLLATPWTATYQAPPPMGFSRQEYWSGVPLPSPICCLGWS